MSSVAFGGLGWQQICKTAECSVIIYTKKPSRISAANAERVPCEGRKSSQTWLHPPETPAKDLEDMTHVINSEMKTERIRERGFEAGKDLSHDRFQWEG